MKTVKVNLYEIDELEPSAKVKALDYFRNVNVDDNSWSDYLIESWTSDLEDMGVDVKEIRFSGFSSQGDGASFIGEIVNPVKLCKCSAIRLNLWFIKRYTGPNRDSMYVISNNPHYVHEKSTTLDTNFIYEHTPDKKIMKILKIMYEVIVSINRRIYSQLEDEYMYQIKDEQVEEMLKSNEFLFFADGKAVNHYIYNMIKEAEAND